MTLTITIRRVVNSWISWRQRKAMERAYPALAELNQTIREKQRRHERVAHLEKQRTRFITEIMRDTA